MIAFCGLRGVLRRLLGSGGLVRPLSGLPSVAGYLAISWLAFSLSSASQDIRVFFIFVFLSSAEAYCLDKGEKAQRYTHIPDCSFRVWGGFMANRGPETSG